MRFAFEQPYWLAAMVLIPLVLLFARGWLGRAAAWRRGMALILRTLILALLIISLARPTFYDPDEHLTVALVVDRSESMSGPVRAAADQWLQRALGELRPDDNVTMVRFGRQAVTDRPNTAELPIDGSATNLEAAIRLAGDLLPQTGERRVVVISDGWENLGDAERAALDTSRTGLQIAYAGLQAGADAPEVAVRSVEAPGFTREGGTFETSVVVDSTVATRAGITLSIDGRESVSEQVEIAAGSSRLTLPVTARSDGARIIRAEIAPSSDTRTDNNVGEAVTVVKAPGQILVLEGRPGEGAALAQALTEAGMQVEVQPPSVVPPRPEQLDRFDGIALANVAATQLTLDQQRTLQRFVQDMGRGLFVAGGNTSFALGGYQGSVLDDMLPVSPAPPPRRDESTIALFLVLDKSGSMDLYRSDVSKMAMAREAAIRSIEALRPNDTLGVLGFDSRFAWVVPPTKIASGNDITNAQLQIGRIRADGGTSIYPALEEAYKAAAASDAKMKHIILMTDGQSFDADYPQLIARMQQDQITLSTIAVGSDSDQKLLTSLAQLGAGRYYFTERSQDVPRITTKETTIATRSSMVEGRVLPQVTAASPIMLGLTGSTLPTLAGYVTTAPRPRAVTALTSDRGDPLLAHWQQGLGRVVAWTSDTSGPWSQEWRSWPDGAKFWQQAVRWTFPEPTRATFPVQAEVIGDQVTLRAQSVRPDGRFGDLLDTRVTIVAPDGSAREIDLPQTAPGTYALSTTIGAPGAYQARFVQYEAGKPAREETVGFTVRGGAEQRSVGVNTALLERLASRTGGKQIVDPTQAFDRDNRVHGEKPTPIWWWFALAALLLVPLDVAVRRVSFGGRARQPARP
ncbi:MAG: VWA domain-containing protein [Chloroflexi bacterium]|nr:VWA domain-containing protein [Chloroflexota bacterium]